MLILLLIITEIILDVLLVAVVTEFRLRRISKFRDKFFAGAYIGHIPPAWEDPRTKMFKSYRNFAWRGPWIKVGNLRADIRRDITTYRAESYPDRVQYSLRVYWDRKNTHDYEWQNPELDDA